MLDVVSSLKESILASSNVYVNPFRTYCVTHQLKVSQAA